MSDADNVGGYACVGLKGIWEISAPLFQFCGKPKKCSKKLFFQKEKGKIINATEDPKTMYSLYNIIFIQ